MHLKLSTNSEPYHENTSSRFKVRLSEPIELDPRGNWEVALADLQVPAKLKKQEYQMVVDSTHPDSTEQRKKGLTEKIFLPIYRKPSIKSMSLQQ